MCERSRLACQLKALLFQHGLIGADDKKLVSLKWIQQLESLELLPGLKFAIKQYSSLWLYVNAKIKEIDRELITQAKEAGPIELMYRSVPGIGPTSARVLANELGDMSQFNNERQLFSYIGLTPTEYSSGEHVRQGHITRQGKPILRKILVQIAWKSSKIDHSLEKVFDDLSRRVGKKKAIIGIARRLIGRIRACFRTGELYRIETKKVEEKEQENVLSEKFQAVGT